MNTFHFLLDLSVAEALRSYPDLLSIFLKNHTGCMGCPMASFCSLRSAIEIYHLDAAAFLLENENPAHIQPDHTSAKDWK